jgi:hypothetical protein
MSEFKVAQVDSIDAQHEPSDSTRVELKADDPTETKLKPQLSALIDEQDKTDLNMDKIRELRPVLVGTISEYSDRDCQRFLVARKFDIQKTRDMIKKRDEWYNTPLTQFKIDNPNLCPKDMGLVATDNKQEQFNRFFPCSNLGEDKEGHPIYWEKNGFSKFSFLIYHRNYLILLNI